MKLTYTMEGTTDLLVPKQSISHKLGPSTSKSGVFFNPAMEFSRDISILLMRVFLRKKNAKLIDGLAGTGARGVRIANEVSGDFEMVLNDHNPKACELIKKNIVLNGSLDCRVENLKLNALLSSEPFDYVDIDPFGSPVSFIDPALQSLKDFGMLAVTATDTAALCGSSAKACLRRYDARSIKVSFSKELGVRILAGYCIREGAKYDLALAPVLSFFSDHYIRIHLDTRKGAKRADAARESLGFLAYDPKSKKREFVRDAASSQKSDELCGPLWTGPLHDTKMIEQFKMDSDLGCSGRIEKVLKLWREEAAMPPYFYEVNEIASITRTAPRPLVSVIDTLHDRGFLASRTHFSPNGFKTDADIFELKELISEI